MDGWASRRVVTAQGTQHQQQQHPDPPHLLPHDEEEADGGADGHEEVKGEVELGVADGGVQGREHAVASVAPLVGQQVEEDDGAEGVPHHRHLPAIVVEVELGRSGGRVGLI